MYQWEPCRRLVARLLQNDTLIPRWQGRFHCKSRFLPNLFISFASLMSFYCLATATMVCYTVGNDINKPDDVLTLGFLDFTGTHFSSR